ncbi:hypothetical protein [Kistimonas scapharcae]|uniref:hypothetical protein n=1 Tax=Kistimonas scapharcae TaxID=1036133 RepID=UPI0031EC4F9C
MYESNIFLEHLNRVASEKANAFVNAKKVLDGYELQVSAPSDRRYRLVKHGPRYFLINGKKAKSPHGWYLFVIKASDPGVIICGEPVFWEGECIQGHTSLSDGDLVLYAGEVTFDRGILKEWTNGSGHYQPSGSSMSVSLISFVKLHLPEDKFFNVFGNKKALREAGGYVPMPAPEKDASLRLQNRGVPTHGEHLPGRHLRFVVKRCHLKLCSMIPIVLLDVLRNVPVVNRPNDRESEPSWMTTNLLISPNSNLS